MMIRSATLFLFLLVFSGYRLNAQEKRCRMRFTDENIKTASVKALSREYRRLKPRHCHDWRSGFWQVMDELGKRVDGKSREEIRKAFGKPDQVIDSRWIYYWRGTHDYLYFDFIGEKGNVGWYNAWD